jgi:tRNA threonylcarbamoyladenosine biosynthesis protein TsaE
MAGSPRVAHTRHAQETRALAEALGSRLRAGTVVGLIGPLGAGKTAFAQGLARGLGLPPEARVKSPTYSYVDVHMGGRLPLIHADLYRLGSLAGLEEIGWEELVEPEGVCVVEWADRLPEAMPPRWLRVEMEHLPEGRRITLAPIGGGGAEAVDALPSALLGSPP